jgi:hypothetical protein
MLASLRIAALEAICLVFPGLLVPKYSAFDEFPEESPADLLNSFLMAVEKQDSDA